MTIKRGAEWGEQQPLPASAPIASSDRELAEMASSHQPSEPIGLVGGDLARTLGATGDRRRLFGPTARTVSCDAIAVSFDAGPTRLAVASVVVGRVRYGNFLIVANAAWLGSWNINPRSHPNDGRIETIDFRGLSIPDRVKAARRLPTGSHLPHPDISVRSGSSVALSLERPRVCEVDGIARGQASSVAIEVLADRLTVVI